MRTRSKLVLVGLGAMLLMALSVGTASARNLSVTSQTFRSTFHELEFVAGTVVNTCDVTLEGSLHARTMPKVLNSLMGYVTRVDTANCRVVTTVLTETLPWHIRYRGFSGNLPNITLILVRVRGNFRVATCLAETEFDARFIRVPASTVVTGISVNQGGFPLTGVLCPAPRLGSLRSNVAGVVTVLNSSTLISVTLI